MKKLLIAFTLLLALASCEKENVLPDEKNMSSARIESVCAETIPIWVDTLTSPTSGMTSVSIHWTPPVGMWTDVYENGVFNYCLGGFNNLYVKELSEVCGSTQTITFILHPTYWLGSGLHVDYSVSCTYTFKFNYPCHLPDPIVHGHGHGHHRVMFKKPNKIDIKK